MTLISRLDCSQITPEMAALHGKAISRRDNAPDMFCVMEPATPGEGGCAA
jgi:hypothetical protein